MSCLYLAGSEAPTLQFHAVDCMFRAFIHVSICSLYSLFMNILSEDLRSCFEIIITSTNMLARRRSLIDAQYLADQTARSDQAGHHCGRSGVQSP